MKKILAKLAGNATGIDPAVVGNAFEKVVAGIDTLKFTGDDEAAWKQKRAEILLESDRLQMAINQSGKSPSWRNAIGWTCAFSFAVMFAITPAVALIRWVIDRSFDYREFQGVVDVIYGPEIAGAFVPVLLGMLGLGAMRSYDKKNRAVTSGGGRKNLKALVNARLKLAKRGFPDDEADELLRDFIDGDA